MDKINFTGTYWTITDGDWYVSYRGSDDTGDGSPTKPFATVAKAISVASSGDKIVIGTGHYTGSVDGSSKNCVIWGDGYVSFKGMGTAFYNLGGGGELHNITSISGYDTAVNGVYVMSGCFINGCSIGVITYMQNCVLLNLTFNPNTAVAFPILKNNTFLHVVCVEEEVLESIENCYFDQNCNFKINSTNLFTFDFCAIEPGAVITLDGTDYSDSASIHADYPSYQAHYVDASAGFNDDTRYDFTLSPSSPLRYAGSDGRFIGALGIETLLDHDTLVSPSLTNLTVNGDDNYNVVLDGETAILETARIDLGERRQLGKANLYADMFFSVTSDPSFSVDDSPMHTTPEILTFSLRFSNNPDRLMKAKYNTYRWEELITNDATGKGNGDPVFNSSTARPVEARYIQVKITMSDTSFYLLQQSKGKMNLEDSSGKLLHNNV